MKDLGEEPSRGRPRAHQSHSDMSVLSSIAYIAAKYNLSPVSLLDAIIEAQSNGESKCDKLNITCRRTDKDVSIFLITYGDRVVCQFPMKTEILHKPGLKSYIPVVQAPAQIPKNDTPQRRICDLSAKMKNITVTARVVEVPLKKLVNTRYGWEAYVSNILLADETGTIRLSLWNSQIDEVAMGDTVKIENASVIIFHGERQLRIGRSGTMSVDTSTRELVTSPNNASAQKE